MAGTPPPYRVRVQKLGANFWEQYNEHRPAFTRLIFGLKQYSTKVKKKLGMIESWMMISWWALGHMGERTVGAILIANEEGHLVGIGRLPHPQVNKHEAFKLMNHVVVLFRLRRA